MTFEQLAKDIKQNKLKSVYLLQGDEAYFIDQLAQLFIKHTVPEDAKDFDESILFGNETSVSEVIESAKRCPWIADKQLVLIKEAQHLKKIEELETYIKAAQERSVLVICYKFKKIDKRKSLYKSIEKSGEVFTSDKIKDWKLNEWINSLIKQKGFTSSPKSTALLAAYIGNDLAQLESAVDKLAIHIKQGEQITEEHIATNIGISKSYNIFELLKALGSNKRKEVFAIVNYFANHSKEHPLIISISQLYSFFSKLMIFHYTNNKSKENLARVLKVNPYFVSDYTTASNTFSAKAVLAIIDLLRQYDLKSKGLDNQNTSEGELLKELIAKIFAFAPTNTLA